MEKGSKIVDSKAFKEARAKLGMTQEQFAAALGMSRISIARMEAGRQEISLTVELALREVQRSPRS